MLRSLKFLAVAVIPAFVIACCTNASATETIGTRVVIRIKENALPANDKAKSAAIMARLCAVISLRARNLLQSDEVSVLPTDDNRVTIKLPGLATPDDMTVIRTFTRNPQLGFYWLRNVKTVKNPNAKWEMLAGTDAENDIHSFMDSHTRETLSDDTKEGMAKIMTRIVNAYDPVKSPKGMKPTLTQDHLLPKCKAQSLYGRPVIMIEFNTEGKKIFRDFTRKHVGDILAIIADGRILTAPLINEPIPGGKAEISGFKSLKEAEQFANQLNAGTLPVPVTVESIDKY